MAKRIVSLLCALAMLATMIVVSAFSASATEVVSVPFGDFREGHHTSARYVKDATHTSPKALSTNMQVMYDENYGFGTTSYVAGSDKETREVTMTDTKTYDLSGGFSASWFTVHTNTNTRRAQLSVQIGKLKIVMDRTGVKTTLVENKGDVWMEYDGSEIAAQNAVAFTKDAYNPNHSKFEAFLKTQFQYGTGTGKIFTQTNGSSTQANWTMNNRCWANYNLTYDPSTEKLTLTVRLAKNGTTDGALLATLEKTDVPASWFENVNGVTLSNFNNNGGWSCIGGFQGTYQRDDSGTVALNANGGTVDTARVGLTAANKPEMLPTPTRRHYEFAGWYDAAEGGNVVDENTAVTVGTLYAHWTALANQMADFTEENTKAYTASGGDYTYAAKFINNEYWPYAISSEGDKTKYYTVGTIGTYSMTAFDVDAELWNKTGSNNQDATANAGAMDSFIFKFGKLEITFAKVDSIASRGVFIIKAKYDTTDLSFEAIPYIGEYSSVAFYGGSSAYADATDPLLTTYNSATNGSKVGNDVGYVYTGTANAYAPYQNALVAAGGLSSRTPNCYYPVHINYADGYLTITTPKSDALWGIKAELPSGANFNNAEVKVTVKNANQGISNVICADFLGTYTPMAVPSAAQPELNTELALNFFYTAEALAANNLTASDLYVDFSCAGCTDQTVTLKQPVTLGGVEGYMATFENIKPSSYGEAVTATLKKGADVVSTFTYSMKDYCLHMLANANASDKLKTLCMDLLNYGEAVRGLSSNPTTAPITGTDTAGYNDDYASADVNVSGIADYTTEGSGAAFDNAALSLRDKVSLVMKIAQSKVDSYAKSDLELVCAVTGGETYRLINGAIVVDGSNYVFTIPVGFNYINNDCAIVLKNKAGDDLTATYHLSVATLCKYYVKGSYGELGQAILKVAASAQAYAETL